MAKSRAKKPQKVPKHKSKAVARDHTGRRRQQQKAQVLATPNLRVLALDTSSTCVGYSLFENGALLVYGKFVQTGKRHGEKLTYFYTWLTGLLEQLKPDTVCFEMPFAGRHKNTFGVLMLYVAIVLLTHFEYLGYDLPPEHFIRARDVKTLNRMAKQASHEGYKADAVRLVNSLYNLTLTYDAKDTTKKRTDDDIADAILINRAFHVRLAQASGKAE